MPNELNIALATTGLTVTCQPYQNGAAVGSAISCPETGSTGFYSGNMAGSAGTYQLAFRSAGANVGSGSIVWDGTAEVASTAPTAAQNASAVWEYATRSITGGTVDTLTNAPTVPSVVQIRQEMDSNSSKLANLDATISSRLAPSGTLATVTTLTNAPTVPSAAAIATQVWAVADKTGYSLTSAERNAIAAAVEASLLNESDGQAILNAIVTAIGNSNVDQVALVAAIRSDLERNGGKLDGVPAAVRSNLATELGRIDAAISTRLASSAYTAPANSDIAAIKSKTDALPASPAATGDIPSANIAAIKAKTDLLNTDRLAQVSTVSTTGAQLAAALS